MTHHIRVGNSFGVRIPKAIINHMGFKEDTNLKFKITDNGLLLTLVRSSRKGWEEAFKTASIDKNVKV